MFRSLLLAAGLTLAAAYAHAQTDPTTKLQPDHYYVNGKPSTKEAVDALDKQKAIKRMEVFTGKEAVSRSHDPASKKIAMVTTK